MIYTLGHLNASAYCLIYTCPRDTQSKNYTKTKTIFDIDVDRDNEKFERDLVAMELKEHTEPMMDVDVPNTAPTSTTAYHVRVCLRENLFYLCAVSYTHLRAHETDQYL
eukprot:1270377-Amorphochlora_amoeboformis.AAC.1